MRVLYFVERFWPYIGGVEVISAHVLPELVRRGHEITIVTTRDGDEIPDRDSFAGVDVRRFPMIDAVRDKDSQSIFVIHEQIAALRRELRPDLVHMVITGPGLFFALTTMNAHPSPTVLSFHGHWEQPALADWSVLQRGVELADRLTACSNSVLDYIRRYDPALEQRSELLLNGLDSPHVPGPLRLDPPVLLCAARLVEEKGIDVAIAAFDRLRVAHPQARLVIAGDGPVRAQLEPGLASRGLAGAVEFIGWRSPDAIAELIEEASVVLVPSRVEGFGLIALEGMLGARPVVASRVGGLPEVLGPDGGLLVEPDDPAALAEAIGSLLADPARARSLAAAGRERALSRFNLRRCVDDHEALYRRLTSKHAA